MNNVKQATVIWLALILLTVLAAFLGSFDLGGEQQNSSHAGLWVTLGSLAILIFKGQLIVDFFMGLKPVNPLWRLLLSAYCVVISALLKSQPNASKTACCLSL